MSQAIDLALPALAYNDDIKHPLHRLPFVKLHRKTGADFWAVPATGGYHGGYEVGEAMAQAYLKHVRAERDHHTAISAISEAFMRRMVKAGYVEHMDTSPVFWPDELASLRGQRSGFFNTVDLYAIAHARVLGGALDHISEAAIISKANAALRKVDTHKAELPQRKPRTQQATQRHK